MFVNTCMTRLGIRFTDLR